MRRIPDDNLSYPVNVRLATGIQGTGFLVNSGDRLFFVTARHMFFERNASTLVSPRADLTAYNRVVAGNPTISIELDLAALHTAGLLKPHPTQDVAAAFVGTLQTVKPQGQVMLVTDETVVKVVNPTGASLIGIDLLTGAKRFAAVLEANEVVVLGYPASLGIPSQPQLDHARPLLRDGIVAAKNEATRTVILDCPVYPGNSGGPVLEIDREHAGNRYWAIGVVVEFVPAAEQWVNQLYGYTNLTLTNSGYSVVVPIDAIDELLATF